MKKFFCLFLIFVCVFVFADETVVEGAGDFENLTAFPEGQLVPFSDVWNVKTGVKLELPGSVFNENKAKSIKMSEFSRNSKEKLNDIYKHFSVYTDPQGENWLRFCVDTDNEKGTTKGSDYLRSEIHCGYIKDHKTAIKTSKGYAFEVGGTFRINTSNFSDSNTTSSKQNSRVNFLQVHEERETGFTNGKHNPPTIQIYADRKSIKLNYCPDRLNLVNDSNPNDVKPLTRGFTLVERYNSLEPINVRIVYTGTEMYVYVNDELKFDANKYTRELYGERTAYKLYENKNSYVKFGCYANCYGGFQSVYVKDIVARHYKANGGGDKFDYFTLKK